ncbi:MAG: hypothetical protein J5733_00680, partial [Bacteroidaceae bacterium]|nr:hypothetical protein [Bacteroidaceae bacterium]
KGETPLIDKLAPFLNAAEQWAADTFLSSVMLAEISSRYETDSLRATTTQVIVNEAFRRALPQLDVILTPNGFGIVSNANIAPASKERIARLLDTLLDNRDAAISQVLSLVPAETAWLSTEQGKFFAATMFPNLEVTLRFPKTSESRWKQYLAIREKAIAIEEFFAAQYLSVELMDVLRSEVQSGQYRSMLHQKVCRILQAVEIRCLQSTDPTAWMHFEHGSLFNLVNTIRENPEEFPEWHSSSTAELYNPPVFENKKESKGFWF